MIHFARKLRRQQTDTEQKLWRLLRNRQLSGFKFRRQYKIGSYIVDFCCIEKKLIVELDGGQHLLEKDKDDLRTAFLNSKGFFVIRFWDHEVLQTPDIILERIAHGLMQPSPQPSPL